MNNNEIHKVNVLRGNWMHVKPCSLPIVYCLRLGGLRLRLVLFTAFCSLLIFSSCNQPVTKGGEAISVSDTTFYTCSMHPQIHQDHPGNCPICGMKLVKENAKSVAVTNVDLEALLKPTNEYVMATLPVTTPVKKHVKVPIRVFGTIEADTRAVGSVSATVSGRIEKLYLRYRFQNIKAGQKVMEIYAPELVTAQENLLFLLTKDPTNSTFINAAKQKLLLLGMSGKELKEVIQTRKPLYKVSVYSKYTGHVMSNGKMNSEMPSPDQLTRELPLKEGMYVKKGDRIFMIMNHMKTWAALQIFPKDQVMIQKGDPVQLIPESDTSVAINGTIDFIEPFFREGRKTLTARVYFNNKSMLTLGTQVTAKIDADAEEGLWIPQTAVLALGLNKVVFIKSGEGFRAHKVGTGISTGNQVQILSGLQSKDTVIIDAQYLMDSESFIKVSEGQ